MNHYRVEYFGRVRRYGVTKDVRALVNTSCEWTQDKLQAAMREAAAIEAEVDDLEITYLLKLGAHEVQRRDFDKEIDLDQMLGI